MSEGRFRLASAQFDPDESFVGHKPSACGTHRTTGDRAWCFECKEWCYPNGPCMGCELALLRQGMSYSRMQRFWLAYDPIEERVGVRCRDCDWFTPPDIETDLAAMTLAAQVHERDTHRGKQP